MKKYRADYTIKAMMMDGGAFMPDPESHQESHLFDAADDAEAKKNSEGYKSKISKNYYGANIKLESLAEVRAVESQEPKPTPLEARVRKVSFDKALESLVDEQGGRYTGKRFDTISAHSGSCSSRKSASYDALEKLENLAQKGGAEAYEITSEHVHDTKEEYDSAPYTVSVTAILYKQA